MARPKLIRNNQRIFPGDGDPRHGTTNGYSNLKCNCEECKFVWAQYTYWRRMDRQTEITEDDPRHGNASFAANWKCRCPKCRAASTEAHREYRERMALE